MASLSVGPLSRNLWVTQTLITLDVWTLIIRLQGTSSLLDVAPFPGAQNVNQLSQLRHVASCHATKEAIWLQKLLDLLGRPQPTTIIHSDNTGSISLTKDATFHARSKHIDVQFHYILEHVAAKEVLFKYLPTTDMPADIMTKALPRQKHEKFSTMLGLRSTSPCDNFLSSQ